MKRYLWKNGLVYMPAIIILFIFSVNPALVLSTPLNTTVDNPNPGSVQNKKPQICHFPDGSPRTYEQKNPNTPDPVKPVTDSEVKDLTRTTSGLMLSTSTQASQYANFTIGKTVISSSTDIDLLSVDRIVQPEDQLHPNSKFNSTAGGIAVFICLTVALMFYAGVMCWKRNGYHNREILLNDEDIGDINDEDMRHFEAACIEINP